MATQQTSGGPRTPPSLPPEYTPGTMAVYQIKTCWPCLALAASPTAGLFPISLYVYGRVHRRGQPGLGVCLFLFWFLVFWSCHHRLSLPKLLPTLQTVFFFFWSSADNGQSDYVHAQVSSWPGAKGFGERRRQIDRKPLPEPLVPLAVNDMWRPFFTDNNCTINRINLTCVPWQPWLRWVLMTLRTEICCCCRWRGKAVVMCSRTSFHLFFLFWCICLFCCGGLIVCMGTLWDTFVCEYKAKGLWELKNMPGSEIFHKYCFTLELNLLIYTFKIKMICCWVFLVQFLFVSKCVGTDWHVQ